MIRLPENVYDHFAQLREFEVLVVADDAIEEHVHLDVVQTLIDDKIQTRVEEIFEILEMILVLKFGCLFRFQQPCDHGGVLFSDSC